MNNVARLIVLLFTVAAFPGGAAADPIQLRFSVEPAETLPGVPVTFRVTAFNSGTAPARLREFVSLHLRPAAGGQWTSLEFAGGGEEPLPTPRELRDPDSGYIEMAPGEERRFDFIAGRATPSWFLHPLLEQPGSYRLRLVTHGSDPRTPIYSQEATITIRTPTGVDAEAWQLLRVPRRSINSMLRERGTEICSRFPTSVYARMLACSEPPDNDPVVELQRLDLELARNPPVLFPDEFKSAMAAAHVLLMYRAIRHELDAQKAFEHARAAKGILEALVGKETEMELKNEASEKLEREVRTLSEIEAYVTELRGLAPEPLCERSVVDAVRSEILAAAAKSGTTDTAKKKLADIVGHLEMFAASASKTPPDMHAALGSLDQAVGDLETALKQELLQADIGTRIVKSLVSVAETSARKAIEAAEKDVSAKRSDVDLAKSKFQEAKAAQDGGDFKKAVSRFREALHKAQTSSKLRGEFC
jgi:tetratricopeptide (TPR) repeat protein